MLKRELSQATVTRPSKWWWLAVLIGLAAQPSWTPAQVVAPRDSVDLRSFDAATTQQRDAERREQLRRQRALEQREQQRGATPIYQPTPEPTPGDKPETRFDLKSVDISKSEILSETEIREVTARYEGRPVGMSDIRKMLAEFNDLYKAKGFITAQAFLPPQKVRDGILKVELVEAKVGKVTYQGNRHTDEFYLKHRLPFASGQLVDIKTAEPPLLRFNRLNDAQLRLSLKPGSEPGTTDFDINVIEPPQYVSDFFFDNQGADVTGQLRGGANLSLASVFGARDSLTLGGYASQGAEAAFVGYDVPFTPYDTRFAFSFDFNNTDTHLPGTGDTPSLVGDSLNLALSITQPLIVTRNLLVRGLVYGGFRQSSSNLETFYKYKFRNKGVGGGFSGDWTDPFGSTFFSHRMGMVLDDSFGSVRPCRLCSDIPFGGRPNFFKFQGSFSRLQPFTSWLSAVIRLSGQVTSISNVPSPESQQAGGLSTVRGYPEAFAIGDDGYVVSAQLNAWLPKSEKSTTDGQFGAFIFYDNAGVFDSVSQTYLNGTGLGLMMSWSQYFNQQLSVGFPLSELDRVSDARFHFSIHFTPPVNSWIDG